MSRYDSGVVESEFEPGSNGLVLRNSLAITSAREMELAESHALLAMGLKSLESLTTEDRFTAEYICGLHRIWLGDIYPWAGQYRTVNVSKAGFTFAVAMYLPSLMKKFEGDFLERYTPTSGMSREQLAEALALVHTEFILIHPFREGNGRLGRWVATLMSVQAGYGGMMWRLRTDQERQVYFDALRRSFLGEIKPLHAWMFASLLESGS